MNQETLLNLCACYLNTNYLSPIDMCNLFNYDYDEITEAFGTEFDRIGDLFEKECLRTREAWFEELDNNGGDGDIEVFAKILANRLQRLARKIDNPSK